MFHGFGQEELSLEEIIKQSCPPPEEKPVEEKAKLAGFPWWGWLLLGGGILYFLSEKNESEVLKENPAYPESRDKFPLGLVALLAIPLIFLLWKRKSLSEIETPISKASIAPEIPIVETPSPKVSVTEIPPSGGVRSEITENLVILNNPIPGYEGTMWGYNRNWSEEYIIPKGGTVYFFVDPYLIIGKEITNTLRFLVFNYNQTTNVSSELITINKVTGTETRSAFSGVQSYKERKFSKDEKYLIKCTENGTRDQPISVWWEIRPY